MAADYTIIQKSPFKLGGPQTFDINLFTGFHVGSRAILSFVLGGVKGADTTLKLRVEINKKSVYSYNSNVDRPGHWSVHQVIAANILTANQNTIRFFRFALAGGETQATISNVVLWGHDAG